ncbi:fumarylacetoacetate hydrolase family protein [Bacillus sp. 1P06AnD]
MSNAFVRLNGFKEERCITIFPGTNELALETGMASASGVMLQPPVEGTVYGTLLNYKGEYESLQPKMGSKPYQSPPKAPILYIKPRNTVIGHNCDIPLPSDYEEVQIGAALGIVFGKTASKIKKEEALNFIKGYTIVNDVSIPHDSYYRPAIKQKARDGFCPVGPWIIDAHSLADPNNVSITVTVNQEIRQQNHTSNLIRPVEQLLEDVTEFMTLAEGDILLVGIPENQPIARDGDMIEIEIEGIGTLQNYLLHKQPMGNKEAKG